MIKFGKSIMYVVSLPVVDSAIMQQITITVVSPLALWITI